MLRSSIIDQRNMEGGIVEQMKKNKEETENEISLFDGGWGGDCGGGRNEYMENE